MTDAPTDATPDPATDATADVLGMLGGIVVGQVLNAMARLGIADHLADGPMTAEEVAERAGSHPRATYRLMRAACSMGLLTHEGGRSFGLTARGRVLRTGVPGSLRSLVMVQTGQAHWQAWGQFPEAVRQGRSRTREVLGADVFEYLARPENAEEAALFADAMGDVSGMVTRGAAAAVDTAGVSTVLDVGGSNGDFVLSLLEADPRLRGQVLDLPHVVDGARREADKRGLSDRFSAVPGDFFAEVPAADLYLVKTILHDWDDDQCTTILRNCRASAAEGARALVVELVVGEMGEPGIATVSDMGMLALTNGMERDLEEYDALFAASGWRRTATYPVGGGYFGLELVAV